MTMEKILVIDDDESIRQTLSNYLKRLGYSVLSAEDGIIGFGIIQSTAGFNHLRH